VTASTFGQQALQVHDSLRRLGGSLHDMRSTESLELRLGSDLAEAYEGPRDEAPAPLAWIEPVAPFARAVLSPAHRTPLCYFLDGSQQTLPAYHFAAIPIVASLTAAGVLHRVSPTELAIAPRLIGLSRTWLAPRRSNRPEIDQFIACAEAHGIEVEDPLDRFEEDDYRARLADYAAVEQAAFAHSRELRTQLESRLLASWQETAPDDGTWIVVDGALRQPVPRAVGLVKSFTRQYVSGREADELFRLPGGYRSPAFFVQDRWRPGAYLVWYLRFRDPAGRDPRYGLVRVEVAAGDLEPDIDALSSWILAERRPRATADSRWPTLLYPLHYLERMLKRYLARETHAWPGTRSAA
jgi:hypothetical protein